MSFQLLSFSVRQFVNYSVAGPRYQGSESSRLLKNSGSCHPEEPKATKDLCICLISQMPGFFASLRMTCAMVFQQPARSPGGQISIMDTLDRAVFEALGRISWLKAES